MGVSDQVIVDRLSDIPLPWVKVIMTQKPEYLKTVAPVVYRAVCRAL